MAAIEKPKKRVAKAAPKVAPKVATKVAPKAKPAVAKPRVKAAGNATPKFKSAKVTPERRRKLVPRPTVHPGALAQARAWLEEEAHGAAAEVMRLIEIGSKTG